jgi:hypothetical protein
MISDEFRADYRKKYNELAKPTDGAREKGLNHDAAIKYAREKEQEREKLRE